MNTASLPDIPLVPRFALKASAASGLVVNQDRAWVVSDDRRALEVYELGSGLRAPSIPLLPGASDEALPKHDKPDFEALAAIGDGSWLALGSGSRPNRELGILIGPATARSIDLSAVYARLREDIEALNIEGAVCCGTQLLLAHRGVGASRSCIARIDLTSCLSSNVGRWPASALVEIVPVALGTLDGVPLAFTDLALDARGRLHYLAAAELTDDPYLDGRCAGTVIGRLDERLVATSLARLRPDVKAEGLAWWQPESDQGRWLLVTDADDPALRSQLYQFELSAKL